MSQASRALEWAALLALALAPNGCVDWQGLDGGECAETDIEIAQGDTYGDFDPWEIAGRFEGTWRGTLQWVYVAGDTGISITLGTGDGSAVAHYRCTHLVSLVAPMTLWVRTEDGALDVVFATDLQLTAGGVPVDDSFLLELRPFMLSPVVLPPDSRAISTAAIYLVQIELGLDTTGTALAYEGGELALQQGNDSSTPIGQIRPAQ